MKTLRIAAVATTLAVLNATASAATFIALSSPGFTTETATVVNSYLAPIAPAGSTVASYSVLSTDAGFSSTATLNFGAPITSYTFLWGSPDTYNSVTDGVVTVTGSAFSSGTGNNAESTLYTFVDLAGFTSLTFKTSGVAFEIAVAPIPEPGTHALLLAGLGLLAFLSNRFRRHERSGAAAV